MDGVGLRSKIEPISDVGIGEVVVDDERGFALSFQAFGINLGPGVIKRISQYVIIDRDLDSDPTEHPDPWQPSENHMPSRTSTPS